MDTESTYSGYSYYSSHSKKSHRQGYVSRALFLFSFWGTVGAGGVFWTHFLTEARVQAVGGGGFVCVCGRLRL